MEAPIPLREWAILGLSANLKALGAFAATYAIMAEPIEMPFEGLVGWLEFNGAFNTM